MRTVPIISIEVVASEHQLVNVKHARGALQGNIELIAVEEVQVHVPKIHVDALMALQLQRRLVRQTMEIYVVSAIGVILNVGIIV